MKNKILYIVPFVLLFLSCQKESSIEFYDLGSEIYPSVNGITTLDLDVTLTVENPLQNLSTVDVEILKSYLKREDSEDSILTPTVTSLGQLPISGEAGTATYTESQLGISKLGEATLLKLTASIDGKSFERTYGFKVTSPFSVTLPTLQHRDTLVHATFSVLPVSETVTGVTIETKVNKAGTYSGITGTFKPEKDSTGFNGKDYEVGDTIYFKVSGSTANETDSYVKKWIVAPYPYKNLATFEIDSNFLYYDLIFQKNVASDAGVSIDLKYTVTEVLGGYNLGFISENNAEFISVSSKKYADGDIMDAETADFSSAVKSATNLKPGDSFIFRTKRGAGAYTYGYMQVTDVSKPNAVISESKLYFEMKCKPIAYPTL